MSKINNVGIKEIYSNEELKQQLELTLLTGETVVISGPAGTGKTVMIEDLSKSEILGNPTVIIFRLQGLGSEDFRLPIVKKVIKNGMEQNSIEFANVGIFEEISNNPDNKYLLFFDKQLCHLNA